MEKQISFSEGLVSQPYSDVCPDGQLSTMHGVEVHAGSVRPSLLLGSQFGLNGELVFIHKTGYYTHYLYKVGGNLYYRDANDAGITAYNDVSTDGQEGYNLVAAAADIVGLKEIAATGNVLTFLCEGKDLQYGMWQDDKYEFLGAVPELKVTFALEGEEKVHAVREHEVGDITHLDDIGDFLENLNSNEQCYKYVAGAVKEFENLYCNTENGGFVHPFYVRAAWKMYDGTYTQFSSPVLMMPNTRWPCVIMPQAYGGVDGQNHLKEKHILTIGDEMPESKFDWNVGSSFNYNNNTYKYECSTGYVIANVMQLVCKLDAAIPSGWKSIITGLEIMVSQPMTPNKFEYKAANTETGEEETLVHEAESIAYGKKNNILKPARFKVREYGTNYREVEIEFDNVSMAERGYTMCFDEEKRFKYWAAVLERENATTDRIADIYSEVIKSVVLEQYTVDEMKKMYTMDDGFAFFHMSTLLFDEFSTDFKTISLKENQYDSIITNNVKYKDTWSRVKFFPKSMIEYNGRLNLYNNKLKYWIPNNVSFIQPYTDTTTRKLYDSNTPAYESYPMEVYVKICRNGQMKVIRIGDGEVCSYYFDPLYYLFIPNTEVVSVIFVDKSWYEIVDGQRKHKYDEIGMKKSTTMDGVYFFLLDGYRPDYDDVQSVGRRFEDDYGDLIVDADIDNQPNTIYTSDTDNPFIYTAKGQNQVGGGRILKMATMTKPLSEGQMGTFPLVAFCTDGNYALSVIKSGENAGLYEEATPMRPDVCINVDSILGIEEGIFFVSQRGLMLMQNNDALLLSEKIDGVKDTFEADDATQNEFNSLRPREFIEECIPAWDYTNSRLLLLRKNSDKAYVFKADDKTWSSIELPASVKTVMSSYPHSYIQLNQNEDNGIADGTVVVLDDDYNYTSGQVHDGLVVTRPIKFDSLQLKRINEFSLHGNFTSGQKLTIYGSNNLKNWYCIGTTKRRHVGMMRGYYFKYWRFKIETSLKEDENISSIEVRYNIKNTGRLS